MQFNITKNVSCNKTPLLLAIEFGNIEIVKLLLKKSTIDVNFYNGSNSKYQKVLLTPLICAIRSQNRNIIELLLKRSDIDVNLEYSECYKYHDYDTIFLPPLSDWQRFDLMEFDEFWTDENTKDYDLFKNYKRIEFYNKFRRKWGNPLTTHEIIKKTPLICAIQKNDVETVKHLLQKSKINVNIPYIHHIVGKSYDFDINDDNDEDDDDDERKIENDKSALYLTAFERKNFEITRLLLNCDGIKIKENEKGEILSLLQSQNTSINKLISKITQ